MITSWCDLTFPDPYLFQLPFRCYNEKNFPHLRGKRTSSFSLHCKILSLPLMAMTDLQRNWCRKAALTLVVAMSHTLPSSCTVERPLSSENLLPSSLAGVWGAHRHWATQRREACGPPVVQAKADAVKSSPPAEESINQAVTPKWKQNQAIWSPAQCSGHVLLRRCKPSSSMELPWRNWFFPVMELPLHWNLQIEGRTPRTWPQQNIWSITSVTGHETSK